MTSTRAVKDTVQESVSSISLNNAKHLILL